MGKQLKDMIMNKIKTLTACLMALFMITGCQKRSGNFWEDNQTGAKYSSQQNVSSLWGTPAASEQDSFPGATDEQFVPLNDEDLKNQFAENAIPQPSSSLGEGGLPSADRFQTPQGELATIFRPVFFNTDDFAIRNKDYLESLQRAAAYLKAHPNVAIIIEGHCDERGPEAYNMALGARRANSVRALLIKQGVNPNQVHSISFGKEKPFASDHGPDAWAQNRRAHFRVHQK
jgi:peptidoglycan-associated lipoprotein